MLLTALWVTSRDILLRGQPYRNMFAQKDSALGQQLCLQAC